MRDLLLQWSEACDYLRALERSCMNYDSSSGDRSSVANMLRIRIEDYFLSSVAQEEKKQRFRTLVCVSVTGV